MNRTKKRNKKKKKKMMLQCEARHVSEHKQIWLWHGRAVPMSQILTRTHVTLMMTLTIMTETGNPSWTCE